MHRMTRTGTLLRVLKQEETPEGLNGILYDLPPDFWHPSMGPREQEEVVGENEKSEPETELELLETQAPGWLMRLGATVIASCVVAVIVAVTVRVIAWILEGM